MAASPYRNWKENRIGGEKILASREGAAEGGFKGGMPSPPERNGQFHSKKSSDFVKQTHHYGK
jgi:hypothetical protein